MAGEALLGHVVHQPRVLLVADPLTAQRADDLLRALTLTLIQGSVLTILGGFTPPYEQIRGQISALIAAGQFHPGASLPSVRQLARDLDVAPNTSDARVQ